MKTFIHPKACVETERLGEGTTVWAGVHILQGAVIGKCCKFGENVYVESKVVLGNGVTVKNNVCLWEGLTVGNDVFIGPNVAFTNDVLPRAWKEFTEKDLCATLVEEGASIGANATILCPLRIGKNALIAAGSVLTRDVNPHEKMLGNPARHHGFVCRCGLKIQVDATGDALCDCGYEMKGLIKGK